MASLKRKFYFWMIFAVSGIGLWIERAWNCFWPFATALMFLFALALLDVPSAMGESVKVFILVAFGALFVFLFRRGWKSFSAPAVDQICRRIERESALPHRPLETAEDAPAGRPSEESMRLWQKHLAAAKEKLSDLSPAVPRPHAAEKDPYAFRHAAILLLALGWVAAANDRVPRLKENLVPNIAAFLPPQTATLNVWITPPEYTGKPAVFLSAQDAPPLSVPKDSVLKVQISGYFWTPRLSYKETPRALEETAAKSHTLEMPLTESGALIIKSGLSTLGRWDIAAREDTAPTVTLTKAEKTPRGGTQLSYDLKDDYGATKITATIAAAPEAKENLKDTVWTFDIPAPVQNGESAAFTHTEDLTSHIWAGMSVTLTLTAEDHLGQKSTSPPLAFLLPERDFKNATARRLIEERKKLIWFDNPLTRRAAAQNILEIANNPALYNGDIVDFMALGSVVRRLFNASDSAEMEGVYSLLWDIALSLEDGGVALATRELTDALQKLSQALNDPNMGREELQALLEKVQAEMQKYLQALAQDMQQRLQQGKNVVVLSPELAAKFAQKIDLNALLEQMRRLTETTSRDALKQMAENLKNTVNNLDMNRFDQMQKQQMEAMEAVQSLDEIVKAQQSLFDKTNRGPEDADGKDLQKEQSSIRSKLKEATQKLSGALPKTPENLTEADRSMDASEKALGGKEAKGSLPHQKAALDALQSGLDQAIDEMAEQMQQSMLSFGLIPNQGNTGEGFDPLGRPGGLGDDDSIRLPDTERQRRVQEIIDKLRNRSNDYNRSKVERDYIDRLLDRF